MAHLSGDEALIAAFESGHDFHAATASRVFGLPPEEVGPELRAKIKAMNYGLAYGLSAFGLSNQLRITPDEARAGRRAIQAAAAAADREIDPEHFGLSIPYARGEPSAETLAVLANRRPDADPAALVPVGREGLRSLIGALVDEGLSKFVVRPASPVTAVGEELDWLADAVLDLQT